MPKQYHKNPRQITTKQMTMLAHDLAELGDLSGIVHDLNSDEIIGGNQRSKVFRLDECKIELTHEFPEPDEQGTVALGYAVWQGKRYTYRQVRWDAKTAEKANIVANKAGGTWDFDILANEFEIDELMEWGFEPFELGIVDENSIEDEWQGMPDFQNEDAFGALATVKVHLASEEDIALFAELMGQNVTSSTKSIWFPKQEKENLKAYRVESES